MKSCLNKIILLFIFNFAIIFSNISLGSEIKTIRIGSGNVDGTTYPLAYEICKDLEKQYNGLSCRVVKSSGAIASLEKLLNNELDIAITQEDILYDTIKGRNTLKDKYNVEDLRYIFRLFREGLIIAVAEKSDIFDLKDLKNRLVTVGNRGAGAFKILQKLFLNAGISHEEMPINKGNLTPTKKIKYFYDGKLEALIFLSGNPNPIISEVLQKTNVRVLDIAEEYFKPDLMDNPYYFPIFYPKDIYNELEENISTLGVHAGLVTRKDVPKEIIDIVHDNLIKKFEAYQNAIPVLKHIKKEDLSGRIEEIPPYYEQTSKPN